MDHPSFLHSFYSTRDDGGFLPADEPSSLPWFADNVFAPPGEPGVSLNGGTPRNNRPALSSIVDIRKNLPYTNGNKPRPKTKMASDPCKPSEAMIKISKLFELPIVCEALLQSPKFPLRAFPFLPFKSQYNNCSRNE